DRVDAETTRVSWRRVALIYAVLVALATYVLVFDHGAPLAPGEAQQAPIGPSLLRADASAITAITFRKAGRVVRATRDSDGWRAVEPAGAKVPSDLIAATVATLTAGQAAEKLAPEPEHGLAAYGLDAPAASIEVALTGAPAAVTVDIGARNPTRTAVYA